MKRQPTVAEIVMFAGGVVTFIFSFLHFVADVNAWSSDVFGLFPITTLIAIVGLAMAVFVALEIFVGFRLGTFLTFNYKQIYVTWGIFCAGLMLCYLVMDKHGANSGAGLWLMLVGSLAMAVGSILNVLGIATQPIHIPTGGAAAATGMPGPGAGSGVASPPPPPPPGNSAPPPPPPGRSTSTPPPPPPPPP